MSRIRHYWFLRDVTYFFNKFGHCSIYTTFRLPLFTAVIFCARSQLSANVRVDSINLYVYIYVYMFKLTTGSDAQIIHSTELQDDYWMAILRGFERSPDKATLERVAVQVVWPVREAADTVFSTPDDGCCDTRNM